MFDTAFHVSDENIERFTSNYAFTKENPLTRIDNWETSQYLGNQLSYLEVVGSYQLPMTTKDSLPCY